jgi:hypothetical protein
MNIVAEFEQLLPGLGTTMRAAATVMGRTTKRRRDVEEEENMDDEDNPKPKKQIRVERVDEDVEMVDAESLEEEPEPVIQPRRPHRSKRRAKPDVEMPDVTETEEEPYIEKEAASPLDIVAGTQPSSHSIAGKCAIPREYVKEYLHVKPLIKRLWHMASGPNDPKIDNKDIVTHFKRGDSVVAKRVCHLMQKLIKQKSTLLQWTPSERINALRRLTPEAYRKYLVAEAKRDPQGAGKVLRRPVHGSSITKPGPECQLTDNMPIGQLVASLRLNEMQQFLAHYMTPFANLPGLLISAGVGMGKTSAALAVATASWVFRDNYCVRWVTKGSLQNDVIRDAYYRLSHALLRELAHSEKGAKWYEDKLAKIKTKTGIKAEHDESFDANKGGLLSLLSYKQLLNDLTNKADRQREQVCDMDHRIYVIDEAHQFVLAAMKNGKSDEAQIMERIAESRERAAKDPEHRSTGVKIIAVTATPIYEYNPLILMGLLRLVGAEERLKKIAPSHPIYAKLPTNEEELAAWLDPHTHTVRDDGMEVLKRCMGGLVSFVNNTHDPRYFAQVNEDTTVRVIISDLQLKNYSQCSLRTANTERLAKKMANSPFAPDEIKEYSAGGKYWVPANEEEEEEENEKTEEAEMHARRVASDNNKQVTLGSCGIKEDNKCGQIENFAKTTKFPYIDSVEFRNPNVREEVVANLEFLAPKVVALLERITELDARDVKTGIIGKHCIWACSPTVAKRILSLLCMTERFRSVHTANGLHLGSKWPYNVALVSTQGSLFKTQNSDTIDEVLRVFNSAENKDGALLRFLVYDSTVSEGKSFLNVRHLHMFEPTQTAGNIIDYLLALPGSDTMAKFQPFIDQELEEREKVIRAEVPADTSADDLRLIAMHELKQDMDSIAIQAIGRVQRFCGHKHLKFTEKKGWELFVTRYEAAIDPDDIGGQTGADGLPLTVFEATYNPEEQNLGKIFVTMQLLNLMQEVSIEREFPPTTGRSASRPHPDLGHIFPTIQCWPDEEC